MPKQFWKTLRNSINWANEAENAQDITDISQNDWQNLKFVNIDDKVYLKAKNLSDKVSLFVDQEGNCIVVKMFDLTAPNMSTSQIEDTNVAWQRLGKESAVYETQNRIHFLTMPYLKGVSSKLDNPFAVEAVSNRFVDYFPSPEIFENIFQLQKIREEQRLLQRGIKLDSNQYDELIDFDVETQILVINTIGIMKLHEKGGYDPQREIAQIIKLLLACIDDLDGHANLLRKYISFQDDGEKLKKAITEDPLVGDRTKERIKQFIDEQMNEVQSDFVGYDFTTYDQLPDNFAIDEMAANRLSERADDFSDDESSSLRAKRSNPRNEARKKGTMTIDANPYVDSLGFEPSQQSSSPRLKNTKKSPWKSILIGAGIALGVGLLLGAGIGAGLMFGGVAGTFVLSQVFGLSMNFGWSMAFNIGLFAAAGAVAAAVAAGVGTAVYHGINYMKNRFRRYELIRLPEGEGSSAESSKLDEDFNPDDSQEKAHNNQDQKLTPIVLSREFQRSLVNPDPNEYRYYADRTNGERNLCQSGYIQNGTIDYDVKSKDLAISGIELRFKNCLRGKGEPRLTRMVFDKIDNFDRLNRDKKEQAIRNTFTTLTNGQKRLNENPFKTLSAIIAKDRIYVASNQNENVAYIVVTDRAGKVMSIRNLNNSQSDYYNSYNLSINAIDLPILGPDQKAHLIVATRGLMDNLPGNDVRAKENSLAKYIQDNADWSATSLAEIANCNDKQKGASDEASILVAEINPNNPNLPTRMLSVWESSIGFNNDTNHSFVRHAQHFFRDIMQIFKDEVEKLLPKSSLGYVPVDMRAPSTSGNNGDPPTAVSIHGSPLRSNSDTDDVPAPSASPSTPSTTTYRFDGRLSEID